MRLSGRWPLALAAAAVAYVSSCSLDGKDACADGLDCIEGFYCDQGRCRPVDDDGACAPSFDDVDGCDARSLCTLQGRCAPMPPCGGGFASGPCAGSFSTGGVCNEGILDGKERLCLVDRCLDDDDCDGIDACVVPPGAPVGICSPGEDGDLCLRDDDCRAGGVCVVGDPAGVCISSSDGDACAAVGGFCIDSLESCPSGTVEDISLGCPVFSDTCCR